MTAKIAALYRYPVKGFSPEPLAEARLEKGGTIPFDRAFAIENGASGFDPRNPRHLPKIRFLMLMKNERLAAFESHYDEASGVFSVKAKDAGVPGFEGQPATPEGRAALEAWIQATFADELRGPPRLLQADGHSFSDVAAKVVHLVNLTSLRELEERTGQTIDPLRFRPNLVIDAAPAFCEFGWLGKTLELPGIRLRGTKRTERCAATNVDPANGARDMQLPRTLLGLYGHTDFGIYLTAETAGTIRRGEEFRLLA
ncbi:MOSC domain-containing protein [Afifella sp. IM 167]|uniref:MOSC domain-containing protein n=1 Tax=Afifella sp. IM 167 TaxID=2033586 RepID=UPI001CCE81B8|nr:MOSC N-terminal beta barrel domain-containing protein [Afifella sp. IM 167]MBZ8133035.1 MOSC domain-containing protein [Afifella sp. IM 167]